MIDLTTAWLAFEAEQFGDAIASPDDASEVIDTIEVIEVIAPAPSNVIVASFGRRNVSPRDDGPRDAA